MYLFFDTETTGFIDKKLSLDDERQPKLLQLAAILADDKLKIIGSMSCYINHGCEVEISDGAFAVNGITNDMLQIFGVPLNVALSIFEAFERVSAANVAHNLKFDKEIMLCSGYKWSSNTEICTCDMAKENYGFGKLGEVYKHLIGKDLVKAHSAMADAKACMDIFKIMKGI